MDNIIYRVSYQSGRAGSLNHQKYVVPIRGPQQPMKNEGFVLIPIEILAKYRETWVCMVNLRYINTTLRI